jgi:hypothetical protein
LLKTVPENQSIGADDAQKVEVALHDQQTRLAERRHTKVDFPPMQLHRQLAIEKSQDEAAFRDAKLFDGERFSPTDLIR